MFLMKLRPQAALRTLFIILRASLMRALVKNIGRLSIYTRFMGLSEISITGSTMRDVIYDGPMPP